MGGTTDRTGAQRGSRSGAWLVRARIAVVTAAKVVARTTLGDEFMTALEVFLERPDLQRVVYNLHCGPNSKEHTALVLAMVDVLDVCYEGTTVRKWTPADDELRHIICGALSEPD